MTFERCLFLRLHCYKLQTEKDLAGEKVYMSQDFINMMWRNRGIIRQSFSIASQLLDSSLKQLIGDS
ncbi:hypothetical protein EUGRSUZ_K00111 [Eucalyptus grandis]|uniref:Uncharacterized protein n=2 Tax=Eucalyptus grandis TaxID=71139 RepID=A0ACC3IPK7_EUCGR|nr:hypothetical protein EUGRSUZ_K00111 [Eucalyptus grandis]